MMPHLSHSIEFVVTVSDIFDLSVTHFAKYEIAFTNLFM